MNAFYSHSIFDDFLFQSFQNPEQKRKIFGLRVIPNVFAK